MTFVANICSFIPFVSQGQSKTAKLKIFAALGSTIAAIPEDAGEGADLDENTKGYNPQFRITAGSPKPLIPFGRAEISAPSIHPATTTIAL